MHPNSLKSSIPCQHKNDRSEGVHIGKLIEEWKQQVFKNNPERLDRLNNNFHEKKPY